MPHLSSYPKKVTRCEITLKGEAGPQTLAMFGDFEISVGHGVAVLRAELHDHAAFLGVIGRGGSLGLELTDVRSVGRGHEEAVDAACPSLFTSTQLTS
jgi:hypothetical protein